MMEDHKPGLWRPALGAVLVSIIKTLLLWLIYKFIYQRENWGYLDIDRTLIIIILFGIPGAAAIGVMVSIILWLIDKKMARSFGIIGRAVIGGVSVAVLGLLVLPLTGLSYNLSALMAASVYQFDLGISVGALAGILSGSRKRVGLKDEPTK
jgi:hypothetical protein